MKAELIALTISIVSAVIMLVPNQVVAASCQPVVSDYCSGYRDGAVKADTDHFTIYIAPYCPSGESSEYCQGYKDEWSSLAR
jgi:hypothetical protein